MNMKKLSLVFAFVLISLASFSQIKRNVVKNQTASNGHKFENVFVQTFNVFTAGTDQQIKEESDFRKLTVEKYRKQGYVFSRLFRAKNDTSLFNGLYIVMVKSIK